MIFTAIYTYEFAVKFLARGFIMDKYTYLRDAWNWLDISVIGMSYVTIAIDLGSFSSIKTFRVFRALKSVAVIPGLKTIVSAIIYSVKNLRDVIILTIFVLAVFALLGLQIYMGVLSQICIRNFPFNDTEEMSRWGNFSHESWDSWVNIFLSNSKMADTIFILMIFQVRNETAWYVHPELGNYIMCGNASGAGKCPLGTTCLQGKGPNPNYGYTNFDTFDAAYLCAFRLMTQDFWENLYQITLRTAGPWHIVFFIGNIFLGSFYLINLILAIVAMSYDELQREAEEEAQRELEELEAIKEAEEAALAEAEAAAVEAAQAMEGIFGGGGAGDDPGAACLMQNGTIGEEPAETPDADSDSGTGPLVDIGNNGKTSPSRESLVGSTAAKYMVVNAANSFSQSVDGVNNDNESDRISMSSAVVAAAAR